MDDSGKRAIRVLTTLRAQINGLCDPERCREYQTHLCNLSGRFIFFIPAIKSIGPFELHTNSFYAMSAATRSSRRSCSCAAAVGSPGSSTRSPFFITKKLAEVRTSTRRGARCGSRGAGRPVKSSTSRPQSNVTALLRVDGDHEAAIVHAGEVARVLEGASAIAQTTRAAKQPIAINPWQRRCRSKPHQRPAGNACAILDLERGVTCSDFAHSMRSLIHAASLRTSLRSRSCGAIHKLSVWPLSMNPNGATSCPESISFSTRYLGVSATPN
jgi:recombination directionality factor gp3-like protein